MKKFVWFFICLLVICLPVIVKAQGQVILDIENDDIYYPENIGVLETGANYINDLKKYVKEFNENQEADITAEIMEKYPYFDEEHAKKWQEYLKNGAKAYAWYEDVKKRVVDWVTSIEVPLRFDDSQYEMGESEEYIETDKPLIIQDFKKVVAYSNSPQDQLAIREKLAIDNNAERPSEIIAKLKKAFINKDWAVIFNFNWHDLLPERFNGKVLATDSKNKNVKAAILSEYTGVGKDGKFTGVIEIMPKENTFALLQKYQNYEGIKVDFSGSENVADVNVKFMAPLTFSDANDCLVAGYVGRFPVYFEGKVKDLNLPVKLDVKAVLNLCQNNSCNKENLHIETILPIEDEVGETIFAAYVNMARGNVPQDKNIKNFDFGEALFNQDDNVLSITAKSEKTSDFKIFIWGEEAANFKAPNLRIDGNKITASFKLKNKDFDPLGKKVTFWVGDSGINQCITEKNIIAGGGEVLYVGNVGNLLLMVVLCGLSLCIMPGALPVTAGKMMNLSEFGGTKNIKYDFGFTAWGILAFFAVVILILSFLKLNGYNFEWGNQYNNPYYLSAIIWGEFFILLQLWNLFDVRPLLQKYKKLTAVCGGVLLAILALFYTPPYMENIIYELNQRPWLMPVALALLGVCAALPYAAVAKYEKIGSWFADPDKWHGMFKNTAVAVLIVNIILAVVILGRVLNCGVKTTWFGYLVTVWVVLVAYKIFKQEIRKSCSSERSFRIIKKAKIFVAVLVGFVVFYTFAASYKLSNSVSSPEKMSATMLNIENEVRLKNKVLVKIDSDWCVVCIYNDLMVFDDDDVRGKMQKSQVREYNIAEDSPLAKELQKIFMKKSLPLYILFSPKYPNGIALSDKVNRNEFKNLIEM